ncbi:hypothetical protein AHAS_Ahas08G0071700 [Arachis hypogaea]
MEDPLGSIFNSHHESADELRQKLSLTRIELETLRIENVELTNLLNTAQKERDEARNQLQKMMKALKMMKGFCVENNSNSKNNNLVSLAAIANSTKANSSITESNSLSRVSSPVDAVSSSPEFSNMNVNNVVDSGCFLYEKPDLDPADALIECLAKGKVLPQQGKLLDAVVDAGPLLRSLIPAGPLPTFRNPPPLQDIKVPPLAVKGLDSFATTTNTCSWNSPSSVLNFGGGGSWNNVLPLTSNVSGVMKCPSSSEVNPSSSPNDLQHHQVVIESFPDISSLQSDGLDSSVISSLPVSEFENVGDHKSINADCVICLGEFEKGEKLKLLPQCAHAFHVSCIDAWFQSHSNCPLCRSQVHHVEDAIAGYSVSSYPLLETLRREDFSRDSDELIRSVRSEVIQSWASRPHTL